MNANDRCSLVRSIRGPITLITLGILFAMNNFTPYGFHQTWPVLLIVFGLLSLLRRGTEQPSLPSPTVDSPAFQPYGYTPPPPPGGYRQSPYQPIPPDPPATPKGGFGSSAPKSNDPQTPPPGDAR